MNPNTTLSKGPWIQPDQRQPARAGILLLLLLLTLPAVMQAQFTYTTNNGTISITGYTGPGGAVDIPSTINGLPVTSIGSSAFRNCSSMTSVSIPSSVTDIGVFAFTACTNLTNITVDPINSAYSTLDGVLFNKNQTTLVEYPAGKAGSYAIPNSVTSVATSAFDGCAILTSVTMPSTVTAIGYWAFANCTGLANLGIGSGVTAIGSDAFYRCFGLTNVTIPNSVTSVGGVPFRSVNT